ncbi:MAG TPA: pyridoxamine 5'-phosphate oxidase family protein [Candidatus Sulfotelmatobacter sp.]
MELNEMSDSECRELLARTSYGRLGCSQDNQPYVVPLYFAYEDGYVYVLSTLGQKIEWMRANPKVCLQVDESKDGSGWASVLLNGSYQELREPQYTDERERARKLLTSHTKRWMTPFAERQVKTGDQLIAPIYFRIRIESLSGLRGNGTEK